MKRHRTFIILFAALSPIFMAGAVASFRKHQGIVEEAVRQKARIAELLEEQQALQNEIEYLSSSVNIEKEARARFNFIREGEVAVILVPQKSNPTPTPQPTPSFDDSFARIRAQLFEWLKLR